MSGLRRPSGIDSGASCILTLCVLASSLKPHICLRENCLLSFVFRPDENYIDFSVKARCQGMNSSCLRSAFSGYIVNHKFHNCHIVASSNVRNAYRR